MTIRCFWPHWIPAEPDRGREAMDGFWVEATKDEAKSSIFPLLDAKQVRMSEQLAKRYVSGLPWETRKPRPFCFLVTRDLSIIEPSDTALPYSPLWNAYCPLRAMPEVTIRSLAELEGIALPEIEGEDSSVGGIRNPLD